MTSKEIVCRLIDEDKINGEEAYVLLNDILKAEMQEVWKTLEHSKLQTPVWLNSGGYQYTGDLVSTTSGTQITANSGSSCASSYTV